MVKFGTKVFRQTIGVFAAVGSDGLPFGANQLTAPAFISRSALVGDASCLLLPFRVPSMSAPISINRGANPERGVKLCDGFVGKCAITQAEGGSAGITSEVTEVVEQ
jgi:hypothetical protein